MTQREDTILKLDEHVLIGGIMAHLVLSVSLHATPQVLTSLSASTLDLDAGKSADITALDQFGKPYLGAITIESADPANLTATISAGVIHLTASETAPEMRVDVTVDSPS